jgi:hypothetical protein
MLLKCGDTWNEELRPQGNGTPQHPIVIGAYGEGRKPLIDRQDDKKDLAGIRLADQELRVSPLGVRRLDQQSGQFQ